MPIDRRDLDEAVARGTISREVADALLREGAPPAAPPGVHHVPWIFHFPPAAVIFAAAALAALQASATYLVGNPPTWTLRALLAAALGLVLIAVGVVLDGWAGRSFVGWLYGSALLIFRLGLASVGGEGAGSHALHLGVDVVLLVAALLLRRPVFALAGTLGAAASIGALGEEVGVEGLAFGALVGLAAAGLGAAYLSHRAALEDRVARRLPAWLAHRLPRGPGL